MGKKPPAYPDLLPGTLYLPILRTVRSGRSLHPSLNRMLVKGWLAAEWGISRNNRKARFYRLTPEGRKQPARETDDFDRLARAIQRVVRTA